MSIKEHLGNLDLLNLPKTAFLCSRQISASSVLKCYDWAIAQRAAGNCVLSGFHSPIEKDVFHYLLKGNQGIILALARGLKAQLTPELETAIAQDRLLVISPFDHAVKRVTEQTAEIRNKLMISLADSITVGYANPSGQLEKLLKDVQKPIYRI
jgi:predicted Rossmann fold nucleotide-binding protein DprA/Smf involved in DNA uptake